MSSLRTMVFLLIPVFLFTPHTVHGQKNSPFVQDQTEFMEQIFPGYEPKTTSDVVTDFRPMIEAGLAEIPPADLQHLPDLIRSIQKHKEFAIQNPGQWVQGHPGLGGDREEYEPSDEELIVSEIGKNIKIVAAGNSKDSIKESLVNANLKTRSVEYNEFSFRHVDVMGSGRFFYASPPKPVKISLY